MEEKETNLVWWKELAKGANPINTEEWSSMPVYEKSYTIFKVNDRGANDAVTLFTVTLFTLTVYCHQGVAKGSYQLSILIF